MQAYREIADHIIGVIDDVMSVRKLRSLELLKEALKMISDMEDRGYRPALSEEIMRATLNGYWHVRKLPDRISQRDMYIEIAAKNLMNCYHSAEG